MRAGQGIIVISITLLMLGVVMVNSAGMQVSESPLSLGDMLQSRPMILALLSMIAMYIGSKFPLEWIDKKALGVPVVLWSLPVVLFLLQVFLRNESICQTN